MDVNYELYRVFHSVAKNLSFTDSAAELFLSQSAVSQSIKQLEQKLSCTLFYRSTKSVRLTTDGEILLEYVEQGMNFFNMGERMIIERQQLNSGEIRIASTDTICKYFLLSQVKNFRETYPNIKFAIKNRTSPGCLALLQNGEADLAVTHIPAALSERVFRVDKSMPFVDVFIAAPGFLKAAKMPATLEELARFPLIVLDKNTVTREYFDMLFASAGIKVNPEFELTSIELLVEMAKAELGIGFAPAYCIKSSDGLSQIQIKPPPERKLGVVTHARLPRSRLIGMFIDSIDLGG